MEIIKWDEKAHSQYKPLVTDALMQYISNDEKGKAAKISYGDFGKMLAKNHGIRCHGRSRYKTDSGRVEGCAQGVRIYLYDLSTEIEMTWNKAAKLIHERVSMRNASAETVTEEQIIEVSALVSPEPGADDDYNADYNDDSESGDEVTDISPAFAEALRCHSEIITGAELAQQGLYRMAAGFRKMRDDKLYKELGYSSFEEYCEKETGMARRNVYKYIQIVEKLPQEFVTSKSQIGKEKLLLLSTLTEEQRAEIADDTDLESTTVRQLRERIDELTGAVEREKELKEEYRAQGSSEISELKRELNDTKRIKNEIAAEVGRMKGLRQDDLAEMERLKKMILDSSREIGKLEQKLSDAESGEVRLTDEQIEQRIREAEFTVKYKAAYEYTKLLCIFVHNKGNDFMKQKARSIVDLIETCI